MQPDCRQTRRFARIRRRCVLIALALILAGWSAESPAAPKTGPRDAVQSATPTPTQDDAALLDVQFVGTRTGWAVGEHGVIWKTDDGGLSWGFQPTSVDCALRSASFLTDRVGWVAGGGSLAYSKVSVGVLLFTTDGGATWQQLARDALPELHRIRFFSLEFGVAVGEPDGERPSGLFLTTDGGKTWRAAPGTAEDAWRTADFLHPELGVLVGRQGRVARLGNGKLLPPQFGSVGLRAGAAVKLIDEREGWMVGDGGLLLCTHDGGLVWEAPPTLLPEAVADVFDFRAIAFRKNRGWIAGSPGSTVWHTPDGGRTWRRQSTGQPLPIAAVAFPSDTEGWAVGAMGMMLHTSDGGESWEAVRGGGRRAAFLASYARPEQASVHLVTKLSGEAAYRGVVSLLARRDVGPDGHAASDLSLRLNEAMVNCGGSAGLIDWRFPISTTGLDDNSEKLVADWNRRSEGRLGPVLLGRLVEQLRIWRPSVLILNRPTEGDAVTRLLYDATLRAVEQAADPTRFVSQQELGGLAPWKVTRVFTRLPDGSNGHATIDQHEYLPHLGTSVATAAALASGRLSLRTTATPVTESYTLVDISLRPGAPDKRGDFFAGLNIPFDSDARRGLVVLTEDDVEKQMKLAQQQRNFHAYVDRYLDDSRHANQLIGQIGDIIRNMPPEQAALQLAELGDAYRRTGQWELAESAFLEVVERYPHEAPARDAMRWLLQMWIGAETTWRRVNLAGTTTKKTLSVDAQSVIQRIENANYRAQHPEEKLREVDPIPTDTLDPNVQVVGNSKSPLRQAVATGEVQIDTNRNARLRAVGKWQERAREMGILMERTSPALFRAPEIQFPLAALYRQATRHDKGEEIYHTRIQSGREGPWEKSAQAELWLGHPAELPPKPLYICRRAERPQLDGVLADPCWQKADELPLLRDDQADKPPIAHAFVMLCYDNDYLYLAGAFPRVGELPSDPPQTKGRTHDADLSKHDRLTLLLDVDRDYATFYRFNVDQRGWTSEDCWGDRTWNPNWYVAVDGDRQGWRIEVAIPMKELLPAAPKRDTVWNACLVRTIPAVGVEGWTHPASSIPRLEVAGMIRFE